MRKAAMRRKGSFMDDLPAEGVVEPGVDDFSGMDLGLDDYGDEMAMEDELAVEDSSEVEMRIASLEERLAALEAMMGE